MRASPEFPLEKPRAVEPGRGAGLERADALAAAAESFVSTYGLPLAVGAFVLVAVILSVRTVIPILSYDDIYRTLFAHDWSRRPFFFTERLVWLPFPLMVTGLAILLTGEAFYTALVVNLIATVVALCYVHRLTDRLFGRLAAWMATTLFALTPWVVILALSRYSEPILLAATAIAAYHWLRWSETGRAPDLALASLALGAAALSRYEAWPLALAFTAHAGLAAVAGRRRAAPPRTRPAVSALWGVVPAVLIGIWVWKNMAVYGRLVYGGAYGFLPEVAPPGPREGVRLAAQYLWQLNPRLLILVLVGLALHRRGALRLCALAALGAIAPWYTVSFFPVDVALQIRLVVLPLMILAPLAGAAIARASRYRLAAIPLALLIVLSLLLVDLRLRYPTATLPMTLLVQRLVQSGMLDRFDALFVQSLHPARAAHYRAEVEVATNFRRPPEVLPPDPPSAPWTGTPAEAVLILGDGEAPKRYGSSEAFLIGRIEHVTAWGVCVLGPNRDYQVEWVSVRAPQSMRPGERVGLTVTLRNTSSWRWRSSECGVYLAYQWLHAQDQVIWGLSRFPFSHPVGPGETVVAEMLVEAPRTPGEHTLELDLVHERVAFFSARGGRTFRVPVRVERTQAADVRDAAGR